MFCLGLVPDCFREFQEWLLWVNLLLVLVFWYRYSHPVPRAVIINRHGLRLSCYICVNQDPVGGLFPLCYWVDRPINLRQRVGTGKGHYSELAGQEDGRIAPKNNRLVGAWLPGSFTDQRLRGNKVKRLFNPCKCPLEWQASGKGMC